MISKAVEHLNTLEAAILIRHKCKPTHRETVFIREKTWQNETIWSGDVEVFDLAGHDEAKTCYAWRHVDGRGGVKIFVLLANQFVDSPRKAIQAALFMDVQPPTCKFTKDFEMLKNQLDECRRIINKIGRQTEDLCVSIQNAATLSEGGNPAN